MRFEHLRGPATGIAAAVLSTGAIVALLSGMPKQGAWVYLPVLAFGALVAFVAGRGPSEQPARYAAPLSLLALTAAAGFRLHHLGDVQLAADWGETWIFYEVAEQLLRDGLVYRPYHYYFHTLYAYIMAPAMAVLGSHELGYRLSSAIISILTVVAFQRFANAYAGGSSAWIGTGLFASSFWHLWASRVGGHKFLLPLFQTLTLLALIALLRRGSWKAAFGLGLWVVLGLHAYWGYYIMPFVCVAAMGGLALRWPALVTPVRWKLVAVCACTVLAAAPLATFLASRTQASDYVASKLSFPNDDFSIDGLFSKLGRNFEFLAWAYSGNFAAGAHAEFAPFIGVVVAVLLPIGLARSLFRAARSPEHLILTLHTAANLAGIVLTWAHNQYIIALMPSVFLYAGLGGRCLIEIAEGLGRMASNAAIAGMVLLIVAQMSLDYRTFFDERLTSDLRHPYEDVGANHPVPEELRRAVEKSAVFVPFSDRRRELGSGLQMLHRLGFPEYAFVARLSDLRAGSPVFSRSEIGQAKAITLVVPLPDADTELLADLSLLYPGAKKREIRAPAPYSRRFTRPMATLVEIPSEDVARYAGPRDEPGGWSGHLIAAEEGIHDFTFEAGWLEIAGREISSGQELFLEAGLHTVTFRGTSPSGFVRIRGPRGESLPMSDRLVHGPDSVFEKMAGMPGSKAPGRFVLRQRFELDEDPISLVLDGQSILASTKKRLLRLTGDIMTPIEVPPDAAMPLRLASRSGRVTAVDERGVVYGLGERWTSEGSLRCQPKALFSGVALLVLCGDTVVEWNGESSDTVSSNVPDQALLAPAADGLYLLDPKSMRMHPTGQGAADRVVRKARRLDLPIWPQRFRDLLLVSSRERSLVYDRSWHRVHQGESGPLFANEDGSEVNPGWIMATSDHGFASVDGRTVLLFEWMGD